MLIALLHHLMIKNSKNQTFIAAITIDHKNAEYSALKDKKTYDSRALQYPSRMYLLPCKSVQHHHGKDN